MDESNPIGPTERANIEQLNHQIDDFIHEIHAGKEDIGRFFFVGQQLAILSQNQNIPVQVREKLQAALEDLQKESFPHIKEDKIVSAKKAIDDALEY